MNLKLAQYLLLASFLATSVLGDLSTSPLVGDKGMKWIAFALLLAKHLQEMLVRPLPVVAAAQPPAESPPAAASTTDTKK